MHRTAILCLRTVLLFLLFSCIFTFRVCASVNIIKQDSLITLLNSKADNDNVIYYLYMRYYHSSAFDTTQRTTELLLKKYDTKDADGLVYFMKALVSYRKLEYDPANEYLLKALVKAQESDNHLLLYHCYTNLAFIHIADGNVIGAIHAYQLARKYALKMGDAASVAKNALGIAMVHSKVELYNQALNYLNKASYAAVALSVSHNMLDTYIDYQKAEIYFKLGQSDSLHKYAVRVAAGDAHFPGIEGMQKRVVYFRLMLQGKYDRAVPLINNVLALKQKADDSDFDRWNLAQCYYKLHFLDSAKMVAGYFNENKNFGTSQLKFKALRLLAQIAVDLSDFVAANNLHKQAMLERDAYVHNLVQIADISEQMGINDLESSYLARTLIYERQRNLLFFTIAVIVLILVIIILFYRNTLQKRQFEKLLNSARTEELAAINSHQVRRHLANILGICDLLKETEGVEQEISTLHEYLYSSAQNLDESLLVVQKKLCKQTE